LTLVAGEKHLKSKTTPSELGFVLSNTRIWGWGRGVGDEDGDGAQRRGAATMSSVGGDDGTRNLEFRVTGRRRPTIWDHVKLAIGSGLMA
jgi:hypothetical protein